MIESWDDVRFPPEADIGPADYASAIWGIRMSKSPAGSFELTMGSDVQRDGMFLELSDGVIEHAPLAEVFYADANGQMTLATFDNGSIPLEVVEWLISEAKRRLQPVDDR